MPSLVNGQSQSLTSVNKASSNKSDLKDSVKDARDGVAKLIEIVLKTGADSYIAPNLASVIGLPKPMPIKDQGVVISQHGKDKESRRCFVAYENGENTAPAAEGKKAFCAYILKTKVSGLDKQIRYFRIDLNGKLEKVVLSQSKYDQSGKIVRGSGVKFDQDIESPEVKKAFEAEMKFWLKDWLKKQQKLDAKKATASAAKPGKTDTASAATAQATP